MILNRTIHNTALSNNRVLDRSRMYAIYRQFQLKYPRLESDVRKDPILRDLVGHRIPEILAGVLIGMGSGLFVLQL